MFAVKYVADERNSLPKTQSPPFLKEEPLTVTTVPPETGPELGEKPLSVDFGRIVNATPEEEKASPLLDTSTVVTDGAISDGTSHSTRYDDTKRAGVLSVPNLHAKEAVSSAGKSMTQNNSKRIRGSVKSQSTYL